MLKSCREVDAGHGAVSQNCLGERSFPFPDRCQVAWLQVDVARVLSTLQRRRISTVYSDGNGVSNNLAESFNWRMRRSVEGIYLSPSNKYLSSYAAETAWREDTRRLSTGKKLKQLLHAAMGVGPYLHVLRDKTLRIK